MDNERFDELIKTLAATKLTRASALRGLVGGVLAAAAGVALAADGTDAKSKKRKAGGKGRVTAQKAPQANAGKVTICHFTSSETNPYNIIKVLRNSVQEQSHLSHGDTIRAETDGCCVDSDCRHLDDDCNVGTCVTDDDNVSSCKRVFKPGDCDDGRFCTVNDACVENRDGSGSCTGRRRDCSELDDQCNEGVCDEDEDRCKPVFKRGRCDDGRFCTVDDECVAEDDGSGSCQGTRRVCPSDQCNEGVCDEENDECDLRPTPGEPCRDGDVCTVNDTCNARGVCVGEEIDCTDFSDQCNVGVCVGGACEAQPTEGAACENPDPCLEGGTCSATGVCEGGTNVCPADECATSSQCGPNQCCCAQQGHGRENRCVGVNGCTGSNDAGEADCCLGQNENETVPEDKICPA